MVSLRMLSVGAGMPATTLARMRMPTASSANEASLLTVTSDNSPLMTRKQRVES
jgi:hypothetical protein